MGGGGLGHENLCTKNGPTRFSRLQILLFPAMVPLVWGGGAGPGGGGPFLWCMAILMPPPPVLPHPREDAPPPPPCVTLRRVVVSLRGPGQSPVLPFACCVGSLLFVGCCGRCSCWCRFRVRGAPLPPPGEPHYHRTRTFSGTESALQNERTQYTKRSKGLPMY